MDWLNQLPQPLSTILQVLGVLATAAISLYGVLISIYKIWIERLQKEIDWLRDQLLESRADMVAIREEHARITDLMTEQIHREHDVNTVLMKELRDMQRIVGKPAGQAGTG